MATSLEALGQHALNKGHFQEAINIYSRLLDNRKNVSAWIGLGNAYAGLEEYLTARWAYNKALEAGPNNPDAIRAARHIEATIVGLGKKKYPQPREVRFRALKNVFEQRTAEGWKGMFIKGVNLGLGVPGYFPGEYPIGKKTYSRWFEQMSAAGINAVRVYAIQSPSFYQALFEHNTKNNNLFLFQGLWAELPTDNNFSDEIYLGNIRRHIGEVVDAVFGNISLPERPGLPHGTYTCDVSPYMLGFIFGREWEGCAVRNYNAMHQSNPGTYNGTYLSISQGSAFENWIARTVDYLLKYEHERYGFTHPASTVCWPTLDPLIHPSESQYDEELRRQGLKVRSGTCNEDEDVATFDGAKITTKKGNGFFATYHAYPYYPDFMNNDFLHEERPYRAYLRLLKAHHGAQPILLAEFGVPSSREVSHWNRLGWHHGGHDEVRQGEINGAMMKDIHVAGMAGGVLFSWFDEWFKRNWLFMDYERPADRNHLWFNLQDAEQCYGLIGAYPGYPDRIVHLKGDYSDWSDATTLYRNEGAMEHRFGDGADASRRLVRLRAQHDEAFLYLLLETGDAIDFSRSAYVIGIDTHDSSTGEFQLPFNLKVLCPVGLKFLLHLSGVKTSRILTAMSYDKYLNDAKRELHPKPSREGAWVIMQNRTNERRISKDGTHFYPARVFSMSPLRHGSLDPRHAQYDSLADFYVSGAMIELRIPWGLMMVTDPSSKTIYWKQGNQETRQTDGLRCIACSYKPEQQEGLWAKDTGKANNATDALPRVMLPQTIRTYSWSDWNVPLFHFYEKKSLTIYNRHLKEIKS